jgi:hypothetical protein
MSPFLISLREVITSIACITICFLWFIHQWVISGWKSFMEQVSYLGLKPGYGT